jgi:hypothetical protein
MIAARKWTTPLLAGTSVLVSVTGIHMFFHAASDLARWAHLWLGWAMVAAAIVHVVVNGRGLGVALRPTLAKAAVAAFLVLTVVASALPAARRGAHGPAGAAADSTATATASR